MANGVAERRKRRDGEGDGRERKEKRRRRGCQRGKIEKMEKGWQRGEREGRRGWQRGETEDGEWWQRGAREAIEKGVAEKGK